jgi:hypothetical protein
MKMKVVPLMVLLTMSCAVFQEDPAVELNAAQISFERVVRSLTVLRKEGKFGESEGAAISKIIHECEDLLIRWEEVVFVEKRRPEYKDFRKSFESMIGELVFYLKEN